MPVGIPIVSQILASPVHSHSSCCSLGRDSRARLPLHPHPPVLSALPGYSGGTLPSAAVSRARGRACSMGAGADMPHRGERKAWGQGAPGQAGSHRGTQNSPSQNGPSPYRKKSVNRPAHRRMT